MAKAKSPVSTEEELSRIIRKSIPNCLQDEADITAEIIVLFLNQKEKEKEKE